MKGLIKTVVCCLLVTMIGMTTGCTSDKIPKEELLGKWLCSGGKVDGKDFDGMKGLFFEFKDTKVNSNAFAQIQRDDELGYKVEGDIVKDEAGETLLKILEYKPEEQTMVMQMEANDKVLELNLGKEK